MTMNDDENDLAGDDDTLSEDGESEGAGELVYPMFPQFRVREGKIVRISIERVLQNGTAQTITEYASPVELTQDLIALHCGGGKYVLRPRDKNNRIGGSKTIEIAGPQRAISEIDWPDSLKTNGAPSKRSDVPKPSSRSVGEPQSEASTVAKEGVAAQWQLTLQLQAEEARAKAERAERQWQEDRDRQRREHEERLARERQEFELKVAREKAEHDARISRENQAHELRMLELKARLESADKEKKSNGEVELGRAKIDAEVEMKKLEISSKQKASNEITDKLMSFGEKVVTGIIEKNPAILESVANTVMGSKLEENARAAVRDHMRTVAAEIGEEVVDAAFSKLTPEQIFERVSQSPALLSHLADLVRSKMSGVN